MRIIILAFLLFIACYSSSQSFAKLTVPVPHNAPVTNCYFSPNDQYLVSTDQEHGLCIWDGNNGRQLFKLRDTSGRFWKVAFNATGSKLAAISDSTLYLIDFIKLTIIKTIGDVSDFSFSPEGGSIACIVNGMKVRSLTENGKEFSMNTGKSMKKILATSETTVLVQEDDHTISVIDLPYSKKQRFLYDPIQSLALLDYDPASRQVLVAVVGNPSKKSYVSSIDLVSKRALKKLELTSDEKIVSIKGSFTANKDRVLVQFRTVDIDGFFLRFQGPFVYSWKTSQKIISLKPQTIEMDLDFTESEDFTALEDFNINSSKNGITKKRILPGSNTSSLTLYDLAENKNASIGMIKIEDDSKYTFATANKSRKVAIFRNNFLLPLIVSAYNDGYFHDDEVVNKAVTAKTFLLDLMQNNSGNNGGLKGLSEDEKAIDDSTTYYESPVLDTSSQHFGYLIRQTEKNRDSFFFNFDKVVRPIRGDGRLLWSFKDSIHVFEIGPFRESFTGIKNNEKFIFFDYSYRPFIEKEYAHLTDGSSPSDWVVSDIDMARGITWEYPFRTMVVDSMANYDSTGEIIGFQAVEKVPFLKFRKSGDENDFGKDIFDKISDAKLGFCQVRYWRKDQYAILSRDGRLFIYDMAMDSITAVFPCTSGLYNKVFIADSSLLIVSNEEKNQSTLIEPLNSRTVNVDGFINPETRQRDDLLILQDASFRNFYLYKKKDLRFLCTINLFGRNDFVAYTKEGLFDGTEKAMENIYFLVNDPQSKEQPWKTIDLKQLKAKYYTPSLLDKLMSGDIADLPDVESMRIVRMAPEIITDTAFSLNKPFRFTVTDKGGGIGPVSVVINGKEVITDARGMAKKDGSRYSASLDLRSFLSYFKESNNTIQVFASNIDSSISSRGVITSSVEKAEGNAAPRLFVISIGVSDYKGKEIDLQYSSKDANDMALAMKLGGARLFGADSTIVYTLSSATGDTTMQPSKPNIIRIFQSVSTQAKAKDVIVVYLSGHGINAGNDFHYLTKDAWSANASTYIYKELLTAVSISSAEFTEFLKMIPALKQLFIIDACASGKLVENLIAHRDIPVSTLKALDRMKDRTGTHVITGCAADAVSYEASRFGQGLLTYSLLEGMKGASLRQNRFLDVSQWFQYARDRVPQLASGLGGIQTPQICSPMNNESFDIAELDDAEKKEVPLARERPVFIKSLFQEENEFTDILLLGKATDNHLNESSTRGGDSYLLFIPVDDFPGSYQVLGRYKINGSAIIATIRVIETSGKKLVRSFTITATSADSLANSISEKIKDLR